MDKENPIQQLIYMLGRLPGVGSRSARRMALQLIRQPESLMLPLAEQLQRTAAALNLCDICGNIDTTNPCQICSHLKRDESVICVVEDVADVWALERGNAFRGKYHILGGTLSAAEGRGPEQLNIAGLVARAQTEEVTEVILAMNVTMEGQTTAHYVQERLAGVEGLKISRLAQGIPMGGELDYLDEGTLTAALAQRLVC